MTNDNPLHNSGRSQIYAALAVYAIEIALILLGCAVIYAQLAEPPPEYADILR